MNSILMLSVSYLRGKKENKNLSFLSIVSFSGIALGVCALIIVTSVMSGFEHELKNTILQMSPHVEIVPVSSDTQIDWHEYQQKLIADYENIKHSAPFVRTEGMLGNNGNLQGVILLGIDEVSKDRGYKLSDKLIAGSKKLADWEIVIGKPLAQALNVFVGSELILLIPRFSTSVLGIRPRIKKVVVKGVYSSGLYNYDRALVFIGFTNAQKLLQQNNQNLGIQLWLKDLDQTTPMVYSLYKDTNLPPAWIEDWKTRNANFFNAIALERRVMALILFIIVLMASFNLSISINQLIIYKKSSIAVLRTIGMSPKDITLVFLLYGLYLSLIGIALGVVFGVPLAYFIPEIVTFIENLFNFQVLSSDVFIISSVPSMVKTSTVVVICLISFFLSLLFLAIPAYRSSMIKPTDILLHE